MSGELSLLSQNWISAKHKEKEKNFNHEHANNFKGKLFLNKKILNGTTNNKNVS